MSSDSDRRDDFPSSSSDKSNPFIAFRHLVDQHFASSVRALNEQAGIMDHPDSQHTQQTPDEAVSSLFNIFSQPPLFGLVSGGALARREREQQQERSSGLVPTQLWGCIFKGPGQGTGRGNVQWGLCEMGTYAWWTQYSPYSPRWLHLDPELPEPLRRNISSAFLDLMALHNGEQMRERARTLKELREAKLDVHMIDDKQRRSDWFDRPQWDEDGFMKPHLVMRKAAAGLPHEHKREEQATLTEEDMYNSFLNRHSQTRDDMTDGQEQASASKLVSMIQSARARNQGEERESEESPIISMVTTSHTTTNPDGSSRTVKRFKKTFADGREESSEDVQDRQGTLPKFEPEQVGTTEKKKGWFWN